MKGTSWKHISTAILVVMAMSAYAQQGPGGVSVETGTLTGCGGSAESTCGVWLDASTLTTLANGSDVTSWPDVSLSADCDNAVVPGSALPPVFRNDPAGTINGLPTITFDVGKHFVLSSSDDLNTTRVTYDKMVFLAFRTSEDVNTKQTIYEEGGNVRGFNIMIHSGFIIIGTYDKQGNDNDAQGQTGFPNNGRTPSYGYSYISTGIQPNTTYILTAQFKATDPGVIANNTDYYLRGWLNGSVFGGPGALMSDGSYSGFPGNAVMGTLFNHPNPCGLGAVNDDTVDRQQQLNNNSGSWPFEGKLAELCYYKDEINETQRIIVENYLASKYIATLGANDYYDYEFEYGKDLVGIGREINPQSHNLSQGRNAFRISASTLTNDPNQYCFIGHNGLNQYWTSQGVPENSTNIERLERIWRIDNSDFFSSLLLEIDEDKLPPPPSSYNSSNARLVLLIDETSEYLPDFSLPSTTIKELSAIPGPIFDYVTTQSFPDGAFFTFAWLKPEVNFVLEQTFSLEDDPAPSFYTANLEVTLNYSPIGNIGGYNVNYDFGSSTATRGLDFDYGDGTQIGGSINIPQNNRTASIPIRIINDEIAEDPSTEIFEVILTSGTPALTIGPRDTLEYTIYDDDPDPKFTFANDVSSVSESAGTHQITILRTGDASGTASLRVQVIPAQTTALSEPSMVNPDPDDFDFVDFQLVSFSDGQSSATINIDILDDDIDELDSEFIRLNIYNFNGVVGAGAYINHDVEIVDNDIPVATFAASTQSGFETQSAPSLLISLDPISSRPVVVNFSMNPGTASYNSPQDYGGAENGYVIFEPFTDEAFIGPFFVYTDNLTEGAETVFFDLTGTTPDGGSTLIQPSQLIYSIFDYTEFEWKGVGGVGQSSDNIIWIDATKESLGNASSLANRSPYALDIDQRNNPAEVVANGINGHQALDFNGNNNTNSADAYQIENSAKINTAGTVDKMSYFFVFSPDNVPNTSSTSTPNTTDARLIYEQGGGTRGTSIYLYNSKLYFHAWNNANDDQNDNVATTDTIEGNQAPWGHNGNRNNSFYAESSQNIVAGQNYIVSCHYENFSTTPLRVFVNGQEGTSHTAAEPSGYNQFGVGRLWGHGGRIGFGAPINAARFHFWNGSPSDRTCAFDGKIGEFISYHEPEMNESRRIIIENYLSAKFEIPFTGSDTPQIWDLADAEQSIFNHNVAGVGRSGSASDSHTNSEGPGANLQVTALNDELGNNSFLMWGHNGESITNSWEHSFPNADLPPPVLERTAQVWKFYETGSVGLVNMFINFSESANSDTLTYDLPNNFLRLLTHSNSDPQDFSNASVYSAASINSGAIAEFQNVPVSNGMYIALGNTSNYFNTPLPIELLSFDAKLNGNKVDLNWVTATEVNNDYFVVERAGTDFIWEEILSKQGAGNSNSQLFYQDVDRFPLDGVSYYRLKQVDFDGTHSYSDIVSVVNRKLNRDVVHVYPNPSKSGSVFVSVPHLDDETITISMTDISGKVVFQESNIPANEPVQIHYGEVPAGLYLINLRSNSLFETRKLVVE